MNPGAKYIITHSFWRHHYDVSAPNNTHLFHIENSAFTPGKPDLTLHRGSNSHGPVVAVCKFRHFSSDCEIGLADPTRPGKMEWGDLHKKGFLERSYSFRMRMDDGTDKTFIWKRTHSLGNGHENHKLVEESSQTVMAVFSAGSIFSKTAGDLDIYVNPSSLFNLMALITGIAVVEKTRRGKNTGASAGGGGGGGVKLGLEVSLH
ncbi:uncharacterized protein N7515_009057 [Penicillium bovifimosum]|uniref:Uncharacterized protein n=1 Tax=Penicillium bovifimosum TaxID=126998 RepID=A0A9W9GIX1_9EURO|nr:uncharacterized protein N7515_009057 [Penicillium bovifimosum]KAJ5121096.1 hypothetical protein N7515_009057 [Penicillium bovifimosum]